LLSPQLPKLNHPVMRALLLVALVAAVFAAMRALLYFSFRSDMFANLSTTEVLTAFIGGLRFDLSSIFAFLGLPLLLFALPFPQLQGRPFRMFTALLCSAVVVFLIVILIGDYYYFPHVKRHLADELSLAVNDLGFIGTMLFDHLGALAFSCFMIALTVFCCCYLLLSADRNAKYQWPGFFILLCLGFLAVRGSVDIKPLNAIDAFANDKQSLGQLTLNGVFTASHAMIGHDDMSSAIALDVSTSKRILSAWLKRSDEDPLLLKTAGTFKQKPNIVVILLEGWSAFYVDSFSKQGFKATPHFDAIAAQSLKFENFFANGTRSIEAIQGILTGIPPLRGIPVLGQGLEVSNVPNLGTNLKQVGYKTMFLQTSARRSFRLDAVARAIGFDEYAGMEDAGVTLPYKDPSASKFGWDYETYELLLKQLTTQTEPFFAFLFTGTTHTPFAEVPAPCNKLPHDPESENGFLNTLCYADWSMGQFFEKASRQSWYDNTIFIITADHTLGAYRKFDFIENHRVPLVVYQPKLFKPETRRDIRSHLDLFSSILELAQVSKVVPVVGQPLLSKQANDFVLFSGRFGNPALLTPDAFMLHSLKRPLDFSVRKPDECGPTCNTDTEHKLLALLKYSYHKLKANQW
jgi:phosphoglycerol transferase MdoB-like AlkP superfamily enzyme